MLSRWQTFKASIFPANTPIFAAATTQRVRLEEFAGRNSSHPRATDPEKKALEVSSESEVTSAIKPNIFDKITRGAGSSETFFFMMGLLALWAVAGAALGTTDQIEESLAMVQGRQTRWQRIWGAACHFFAITLGSLWAFLFYWAGIFVWVGIGPLLQFSDVWQLYINTATAISLTFTSVFLQNVQQQQEDRLDLCLNYALKIDAQVEYRLREITEDPKPNPIFEIPADVPSRVEPHNTSNQERGEDFNGVLKRRLLLNSYVNAIPD
ncbi:low affinity iron transporter-like protein [Diplocarpon rosae]|nr:low affinity iron transporter-like protein [Diplocarpon rosae]